MLGLAGGGCDAGKKAKCQEAIPNPEYLRWTCERCGKKAKTQISPYTAMLVRLAKIRSAGYDIDRRLVLPGWVWMDLATVTDALQLVRELRWRIKLMI